MAGFFYVFIGVLFLIGLFFLILTVKKINQTKKFIEIFGIAPKKTKEVIETGAKKFRELEEVYNATLKERNDAYDKARKNNDFSAEFEKAKLRYIEADKNQARAEKLFLELLGLEKLIEVEKR